VLGESEHFRRLEVGPLSLEEVYEFLLFPERGEQFVSLFDEHSILRLDVGQLLAVDLAAVPVVVLMPQPKSPIFLGVLQCPIQSNMRIPHRLGLGPLCLFGVDRSE